MSPPSKPVAPASSDHAEPEPGGSARRAAVHWCAVAALVALVEVVGGTLPAPRAPIDAGIRLYPASRVPTLDESTIQWQVDRLARTPTDIFLFGDSSALNGLDPAAFADVTGLTAQNFGTVRWLTTDGHADLLDLYVERHGAPRVAIYQMGTGLHAIGVSALRASGSARGQLLHSMREWIGHADDEYPVALPSLAYRPLARAAVEGRGYHPAYTSRSNPFGRSDEETRRRLEEYDGMSTDLNPRPLDAWVPEVAPAVHYDPDIEPGLVRMFEIAHAHGFPLLVAHNPIPDVYRDDERSAAYELVERRLVAVAAPYPEVRVLGPFARYAPTGAFANFEHLSPEGARRNSQQLAGLVTATLGLGGRTQ